MVALVLSPFVGNLKCWLYGSLWRFLEIDRGFEARGCALWPTLVSLSMFYLLVYSGTARMPAPHCSVMAGCGGLVLVLVVGKGLSSVLDGLM